MGRGGPRARPSAEVTASGMTRGICMGRVRVAKRPDHQLVQPMTCSRMLSFVEQQPIPQHSIRSPQQKLPPEEPPALKRPLQRS